MRLRLLRPPALVRALTNRPGAGAALMSGGPPTLQGVNMSPLAAANQSSQLIDQPSATDKLVRVQPVEAVLIAVATGAALITLVSLLTR